MYDPTKTADVIDGTNADSKYAAVTDKHGGWGFKTMGIFKPTGTCGEDCGLIKTYGVHG